MNMNLEKLQLVRLSIGNNMKRMYIIERLGMNLFPVQTKLYLQVLYVVFSYK